MREHWEAALVLLQRVSYGVDSAAAAAILQFYYWSRYFHRYENIAIMGMSIYCKSSFDGRVVIILCRF